MSNKNIRILHLSLSPLEGDGRVQRAMEVTRASGYDLRVLASGHGLPKQYMSLSTKLHMAMAYGLLGRFGAAMAKAAFWSFRAHRISHAKVLAESPDLIHAHDWDALPIAADAAARLNVPFIYDSHENAVDMFSDRLLWQTVMTRAIAQLEADCAKGAAAVITVSDILAEAMKTRLALAQTPLVVRNIPANGDAEVRRVNNDAILLHYHGILCSGRGLEASIQALRALPERFSLRLIGPLRQKSTRRNIDRLLNSLELRNRVTVGEAVPVDELISLASQADIGLILLEANSTHNRGALPNKLFEYIHAGLMVIASGSDAMRSVIETTKCGVFLNNPTPEHLAAVLSDLSRDKIEECRRAARKAQKTLSWTVESRKLSGLYASKLN